MSSANFTQVQEITHAEINADKGPNVALICDNIAEKQRERWTEIAKK